MILFLTAALLMFPLSAFAHCPIEIEMEAVSYCLDIQWIEGEKKSQGSFVEAESPSPHLVEAGQIPQKWIYSQAQIQTWKKGDTTHQPAVIENFRVFPYMHMTNGHHHSTSYEFSYDSQKGVYVLNRMALQEMAGCWSLRSTTQEGEDPSLSQFLQNIVDYPNLDETKNEKMATYCSEEPNPPADGGHHQH